MNKNIKKVVVGIIIIFLLVIGLVIFRLYNNGFKFYTYSTENLIEEQIESIIKIDTGESYEGRIEELALKKINDYYLAFFDVKDSEDNQCIIAKYKESFNLGKNKVLSLDKIIKSSNSVAMMDIEAGDANDYLILISTEDGIYESINIVSDSSDEIIATIDLTDEGVESFGGEKLKDNMYLMQYTDNTLREMGIELVKKSEE